MAPGPSKAIGKGLVTNGFVARLLTERYVAGRSQNSLVAGLARQGAQISAATLTGTCAQAGVLLAPLEEAITARSRDSWHLHADETSWRVFAPHDGDGPARWWLWVFLGPDTTCFVMDPTRAGAVLARHAGIDSQTGQLVGDGPRRLVISSDFYTVYTSAGKKADGLVNLYCLAHVRRHFVRAGDANPTQLKYWTAAWLERIKALYAAHEQLMVAWTAAVAPTPGQATAAATRLAQACPPTLQEVTNGGVSVVDGEHSGPGGLALVPDDSVSTKDGGAGPRRQPGSVAVATVSRKSASGGRGGSCRHCMIGWVVHNPSRPLPVLTLIMRMGVRDQETRCAVRSGCRGGPHGVARPGACLPAGRVRGPATPVEPGTGPHGHRVGR